MGALSGAMSVPSRNGGGRPREGGGRLRGGGATVKRQGVHDRGALVAGKGLSGQPPPLAVCCPWPYGGAVQQATFNGLRALIGRVA